ncbi:DUF4270 domain-containing protein [Flavobacterium piscis]|uniref:DUF4270 domain-containing protein n=1 Tax=Flavobacterium piscis TaxID=1114874 RepID=A0ABU1YAE7_9FLAO|nr:DUF4270 domain-containing protein [Flavobacterium piscis]MDR7211200.1 hypothetical protein [Flavobacterium piscis]
MYNTSFIKKTLLVATLVLLYSCDKDFNTIGDDIIGDNHFGLEPELYDVKAYNQKVTPVIANNLSINALGIYDNPAFGVTTANFNTQVSMTTYSPVFGEGVIIDSITLHIPYFSTIKTINGLTTYELDSIYGPPNGKIKLSVYESGIFMNNYKVNDVNASNFYYTDKNGEFQTQSESLGTRLNNRTLKKRKKPDGTFEEFADDSENDGFYFNSNEIIETTKETETAAEVIKKIKPEMRLHLDTIFFRDKIFNAPASKLAADDVFKNYFKGLYFKVENSGTTPGTMAMLNFSEGKINIFYRAKTAITTDAETERESKTLVINLQGNTTSLLQESNPVEKYATASSNATDQIEDEKLYIKGGQGSMAIIELSDFENQLTEIRKNVADKKWIVNEANLIFYVDESEMNKEGVVAPERVYLYNATNNTPLRDYLTDASTFSGVPKKNRYIFDGMIQKITENNTTSKIYKIRITDHIRNILKNDSAENVKLGLVVTESIAISTSNKLDPKSVNSNSFKEIPTASVMSPLGTVLFGGTAASGDKRVKLQVYYTKIN